MFHETLLCISNTDGLLQLHQDFTAYEQHSSVRLWDLCLQPHLCLHSKCLYETVPSVAVTCSCVGYSTCVLFLRRSRNFFSFIAPFFFLEKLILDSGARLCVHYIPEEEHLKPDSCCFLPLSSLSRYNNMCIILLRPVLKGKWIKNICHL